MSVKTTFKEHVRQSLIDNARKYQECYIDYQYLLCSEAFKKNPYYIINAHMDNYRHLTGVSSGLSALLFFEKCLDGTIKEDDFDFDKPGHSPKVVKGTVRRKLSVMEDIFGIFSLSTMVEEDFKKNRIICSFAAGHSNCTVGFNGNIHAKPMTLLKGNELDMNKAKSIELILRKKTGAGKFDELFAGSPDTLRKYSDAVWHYCSVDLLG